jgi:CheY-like chemotaxis protein
MHNPNVKSAAASKTNLPISRNALKVLLVDDDSFQLEMISGILEGLGVTDITMASSGEQALQKLSAGQSRFNLVLLDLHMPGMDGFKFMESLAKVGYTGALIIVSGQSDDVMHAASMVAKIRRFTLLGTVPKPVGRAALSALLSKLG